MPHLINLVYKSTAVCPMTQQDLLDLLIQSREKNHRLHVTGMLLYQKMTFLQVLEGNKTVVEEIFTSIVRDARHTNVTLLLKHPIKEREYTSWDMKFSNLDTIDLSKISGYADYVKKSLDSSRLEMGSFAYTFLQIFKDL